MGQRTMLWIVTENPDGSRKVCGYYHHNGIGRVMPEAVMAIVMGCNRHWVENTINGYTESTEFMNAETHGFREEFRATYDRAQPQWLAYSSPQAIGQRTVLHDNNNGAMVLYIKAGVIKNEETAPSFSIGFLMGKEEEYRPDRPDKNTKQRTLGPAFSRWLTLEEWEGLDCNEGFFEYAFGDMFRAFLKEYDVTVKQ